jgi:hypothetical protein
MNQFYLALGCVSCLHYMDIIGCTGATHVVEVLSVVRRRAVSWVLSLCYSTATGHSQGTFLPISAAPSTAPSVSPVALPIVKCRAECVVESLLTNASLIELTSALVYCFIL